MKLRIQDRYSAISDISSAIMSAAPDIASFAEATPFSRLTNCSATFNKSKSSASGVLCCLII